MATFTFYGTSSVSYYTSNSDGQIPGYQYLAQGGANGGQLSNAKSMVIFDSTAIRNALVGYTVTACTLNFYVHDCEGSQATIFIGTHNFTSLPNTWSTTRTAPDRVRYDYH